MNNSNDNHNGGDSQAIVTTSKLAPPIFQQNTEDETDQLARIGLRVWPKLALAIGESESILLLQIEYLLRLPDKSNYKVRDGRRWIYHSAKSLQDKFFPHWSVEKIRRTTNSLVKQGLVISGNYNKHNYDRTKWFTLNLEGIAALKDKEGDEGQPIVIIANGEHLAPIPQNGEWIPQNEGMDSTNHRNGFPQNGETIPETPTEDYKQKTTTKEREANASDSLSISGNSPFGSQIEQAINLYQDEVGSKLGKTKKKAIADFIEHFYGGFDLDLWEETITSVIMGGCKPGNLDAIINTYWWGNGDYGEWQGLRLVSEGGHNINRLEMHASKPHWKKQPTPIHQARLQQNTRTGEIFVETYHGVVNVRYLDENIQAEAKRILAESTA